MPFGNEPLSVLAIIISVLSSIFVIWFEVHYKQRAKYRAALAVVRLTLEYFSESLDAVVEAHPRQQVVPVIGLPSNMAVLQLAESLQAIWERSKSPQASMLFCWYQEALALLDVPEESVSLDRLHKMKETTLMCIEALN